MSKCVYNNICPSRSGWCNDSKCGENCISFLQTHKDMVEGLINDIRNGVERRMITSKEITSTENAAFVVARDFNELLEEVKHKIKVLETQEHSINYRTVNGDGVEDKEYFETYDRLNCKLIDILNVIDGI